MPEPRHRPDEVAARSFPSTFRGFDPAEVRRYLASVAGDLAAAAQREASLREDLARARASLARPEIDETVLMAALGEETTKVLVAARAAANDIRNSADDNAAATLARAHEEAEQLRAAARGDADELVRRAEGLLAVRTREADDAAAELVVVAGEEAERIRESGLDEARALVAEARSVRERMLDDLRQRVRRGEAAFAALQVGRDTVLGALGSVRDALDGVSHELATAEARARHEAEPLAARAADEAVARVDAAADGLPAPVVPSLGARVRTAAEVRLAAAGSPVDAEQPATATAAPFVEQETDPETEAEPEEPPAVATADEPLVHTGEPSGPVAAVVPIGAVFQEHHEDAVSPSVDTPPAAPATGEVAVIAATGTDTYSAESGRRSRRRLRLAGEPAVRAEEQRLASMRYLHRPRTGTEHDVHLPEDGMVVVEPPSADEAVRIVGRVGPPAPPPAPRPAAPTPTHHGGPDEPAVTVLGPVRTGSLPTRRPPGAGAASPPPPPPEEPPAVEDEVATVESLLPSVEARPVEPTPADDVAPAEDVVTEAPPEPGSGAEEPAVEETLAEEQAAAPSDVDALFARLRAGREAEAHSVPEVSATVDAEPEPEPEPAPTTAAAVVDDEAALQVRDAVTTPLEAQLAKIVKRLLQDQQNDILDKLRAKRPPSPLELLGAVEDLVRPLSAAAAPLLAEAAAGGAATLRAPGATPAEAPVTDLAGDVAANVVRDLRPRLEDAFSRDGDEVNEAVHVAFREWRGARVGRLVGDALHVAFTRGCFVAVPQGTRLRWVADDGEQACPDCDDDALAGPLRKGKAFPTGHRHPPAHSGCRCILVRA